MPQGRQRRRIRPFIAVREGGLIVQFCSGSVVHFLSSNSHRTQKQHTLHTILLHRRHSPTMSRAHLPTFPRDIRPGPPLLWLSSCSTDLTLFGMMALSSSISATVSIYSFSQRRVSRTSWCRKGARLTWNWRHVRDKAWRVFKSTARAISLTMLNSHPKRVQVSDG